MKSAWCELVAVLSAAMFNVGLWALFRAFTPDLVEYGTMAAIVGVFVALHLLVTAHNTPGTRFNQDRSPLTPGMFIATSILSAHAAVHSLTGRSFFGFSADGVVRLLIIVFCLILFVCCAIIGKMLYSRT